MANKEYSDQQLYALHERREQTYLRKLTGQRQHADLFKPYSISQAEYRVLALLYFSDGCEPSVMADRLLLLRQTMTKVIDSLEQKELVVRTVHPSDRRKLFINLLPEGRRLVRELLSMESDYLDRVDAQFTPEELDTYLHLRAKIQTVRSQVLQQIAQERAAEAEAEVG